MAAFMKLSYFITPALGLDALNLYSNVYRTFVILDLGDSVHMRVKPQARQELARFDFNQLNGKVQLGVRINPIASIEGVRDIELLYDLFSRGGFPITHIVVPNVNNKNEMLIYDELFASTPTRPKLIPVIETSEAIDQVDHIAVVSDGLMCGQLDLVAGVFSSNQRYVDSARTKLCIAAAKRGIVAIDTNSFELEDLQALETECLIAKSQGFTAKVAVHMAQVQAINNIFSISDEEVARCRSIINEYDATEGGMVAKEGRLAVSAARVARAKRIIEFYDAHTTD